MEVGKKYTLVAFDSRGYPFHMHMNLKAIRCDSYAQHAEAYFLEYRKSGSMFKYYRTVIHPGKNFLIYPGWVNPDTSLKVVTVYKDGTNRRVQMIKKYYPYNGRYLQRAKLSIPEPPLSEFINPNTINDRLMELCTVIT